MEVHDIKEIMKMILNDPSGESKQGCLDRSLKDTNKVTKGSMGTFEIDPYYSRPVPLYAYVNDWFVKEIDGKSFIEWNIDGMSEHQIKITTKQIFMFTLKAKSNGNTNINIAKAIVNGFLGQLQGWWDHHLNENYRN